MLQPLPSFCPEQPPGARSTEVAGNVPSAAKAEFVSSIYIRAEARTLPQSEFFRSLRVADAKHRSYCFRRTAGAAVW
jgi:hypothetical protein